ncbi:MAG: biotin--[acetyl-CoA-carboxylase] ligase [Armatimonadia bacterium]
MHRLDIGLVQQGLRGLRLRGPFVYKESVASTNDEARDAALAGAAEGSTFIAETQTAGRGRQGRQWHSPPGQSLLFSVLLRPALPPQDFALLTTIAGLAVVQASAALTGCDARTKWPNDVVIAGRKLVGILTEARLPDFAVIGIGVNVSQQPDDFPPELRSKATSLAIEGVAPSREALLAEMLNRLDALYDMLRSGCHQELLALRRQSEVTLGRRVIADLAGRQVTGTALDLTADGGLIIRTAAGDETIHSGEIVKMQSADPEGWA